MKKNYVIQAGYPLLAEVLATITGILVLALLMLNLEWQASYVQTGIWVIYGFACFWGGFTAGRATDKKRFLKGMLYGALYFLLLFLLSELCGGGAAARPGRLAGIFAVCLLSSMAGGMLSGIFGK